VGVCDYVALGIHLAAVGLVCWFVWQGLNWIRKRFK
jgi:hypothetical protein